MLERLQNWWQNLDENYKKVALTLLFSITVVILAYATYYVFFRPTPPPPPSLTDELPIGTLPTTDLRELLQQRGITPDERGLPTLAPSELKPDAVARGGRTHAIPQIYTNAQNVDIAPNGSLNYYDKNDGQFYSVDENGNVQSLSSQKFPDVENVVWSPQGNKGILEFPDGSNIYYDFNQEKQHTLPQEGEGFNFSPSGDQIGYRFMTPNPDENWLVVSAPTGDKTVAIEHIGEASPEDVMVNWSSDSNKVGFFRSSAGIDSEEIFFIGKNKENFKSLEVEGRGFEGVWSPQGDKLLYNVYNAETGYRPELWVSNASDNNVGTRKQRLGLYSWVSKCAFASDNTNIYCAVPLYLKQGSGIYPSIADTVPDVIYKINARTGFKQQIAVPTDSIGIGLYTVDKLMLSPDGKVLHMADKRGGIYKIRLEE